MKWEDDFDPYNLNDLLIAVLWIIAKTSAVLFTVVIALWGFYAAVSAIAKWFGGAL